MFDNTLAVFVGGSFYELENEDENAVYYEMDFESEDEMADYGQQICKLVEAEGAVLMTNENDFRGIDIIRFGESIDKIPEKAFREAIANALVHRTWDVNASIKVSMYSDRVEINSPGGLPVGLSEEESGIPLIKVYKNSIYHSKML